MGNTIVLYSLFMFKKRDQLLELLKKDQQCRFLRYLDNDDLLSLALSSKRYYLTLKPILTAYQLDEQNITTRCKAKNKPKKQKNKQQTIDMRQQIEVEVEKVPLHRFHKYKNMTHNWTRIDELPFRNDYLNKKLQNRTVVFYKNNQSGELIYINRSMVDPSLNYNKGGFGQSFIENELYEHFYDQTQLGHQDFSSMEAILKRQKQLLEKTNMKKEEQAKNAVICYEDELAKVMSMKRVGIILCFGGSFSFGIFQGGRCVLHKSDKKYVCRQKAGERQFNRDKQSGSSIQSIGSQIRRDQQKKHVINVGHILKENHNDLSTCEIIFLQAPGLNRLFVINEKQNLEGLQDRLRSVCVTARKANFTEVEALFETISIVNIVREAGKEEQKMPKKSKKKKEKSP